MNKIVLTESNVEYNLDGKIKCEYVNDLISKLKIKVLKDTKLEIDVQTLNEIKLDIQVDVMDNVKLEIIEIKKNVKSKILNKYNLQEDSNVNIIKINDVEIINEKNVVNLNGDNASINVILKTVSEETEKYDFVINHNASKTISDINTNGLNISGNLYFNVTTLINKGYKDCIANQNNRIVNLADKECIIKPNLLIEEVDVTANHSALVGGFKDDEIFYMERLGIPKIEVNKLLIEGFIKSKISEKLANNFKKYWR